MVGLLRVLTTACWWGFLFICYADGLRLVWVIIVCVWLFDACVCCWLFVGV